MQFVTTAGELASALALAKGIVPTGTTIPILSHVHVSAECSRFSVLANNLTAQVATSGDCECAVPGKITIPGHTLLSLVKSFPKTKDVSILIEDVRATIVCGKSKYVLPTLPSADFPNMPEDEASAVSFAMPVADLLAALEGTRPTVGTQEARHYLCGVAACLEGNKLAFVSTDGHRLSRVLEDQPDGSSGLAASIIPTDAVVQIIALCAAADGEARIALSESRISVTIENVVFKSRLVDGSYPDYLRVIPRIDQTNFTVNADALGEAVDRLLAVSSAKTTTIGIKTNGSGIDLRLGTGTEQGFESVAAEISAAASEFGANAKYVAEMIRLWPKGADLDFQCEAGSPILITSKAMPGQTSLIMSYRI